MLQQLSGCPVYQFTPRITFGNGVVPAAMYGLKIPPELSSTSVPAPDFVDPAKMISLRNAAVGGHGTGISVVHGLTVTEFAVTFPKATQWRQVGTKFSSWQFQGGDVLFDVTIRVYVLEGDRPKEGDDLSRQLFAIIMEHELLHVLDEIEIVTKWMPPQAYKDDMVVKYLTNAAPVDQGMYQSWFKTDRFSNWMKDGLWTPEHNRRATLRDAASQYAALQNQIDDIRIKMTNRPSR